MMRKWVLAMSTLLCAASAVFAGDVTFGVLKAEVTCKIRQNVPEPSELAITFDRSFRAARLIADTTGNCSAVPNQNECREYAAIDSLILNLTDSSHYRVMNLRDGSFACLDRGMQTDTFQNQVAFLVSGSFRLGENYVLIAPFTDSKRKTPVMIKIEQAANCATLAPTEEIPVPEDQTVRKEPFKFDNVIRKAEEGAVPTLALDLSVDGAKTKKTVYSIKADFRPASRRRFGLGGYYDLTYLFLQTDVRINSTKNDRKNVLTVGSEFKISRIFHEDGNILRTQQDSRSRFPGLSFVYTPKIETEWGFGERNLIPLDFRGELPINLTQSRSSIVRIQPFLGFEGGYIWRSENNKPGWNIARPYVGADLFVGVLRKNDEFLLSSEIGYIRRIFLKPETSYVVNEAGAELADKSTRRVRDHVFAKLSLNYKVLSPFLSYEYGRLPPKYILQNSVFKFGFRLNADFWWKRLR